MKLQPPVQSSFQNMTIDISEIEPLLQGPPSTVPACPEAQIKLRDGRTMFIRSMTDDDIDPLLGYMEKIMKVQHDFYDIVGVRVYAEILAVRRKRMKDPFTLLGLVDGQLTGFANGRLFNKDIAISLHTMTFARRGRIGYAMYYAKTYYALEIARVNEWWSTFESYNGWRMAGLEMAQPTKPWPEYQHELGGATIYYVTKDYWDASVKNFAQQMIGSDLDFNVTDEVRKANEKLIIPDEVVV